MLKKNNIWFVGGFSLVIIALLSPLMIIILTQSKWTVKEIGDLGSVGDFLGGSTVGFLSLASILFVIHTITIQSKELELAREEFKISNHTAKSQQIENTIFKMIEFNNSIISNIYYEELDKNVLQGKEAINAISKEIQRSIYCQYCIESLPSYVDIPEDISLKKLQGFLDAAFNNGNELSQYIIDQKYKEFIRINGNILEQYMKNIQKTITFISESIATNELEREEIKKNSEIVNPIIADKEFYMDLLVTRWSIEEKNLILIFSLYSDNDGFNKIILKNDILKLKDDFERQKPRIRNIKLYKSLVDNAV